MGIATVNPSTGETLQVFTSLTDSQIKNKLSLAEQAFEQYRKTPLNYRQARLLKAASILEEKQLTMPN